MENEPPTKPLKLIKVVVKKETDADVAKEVDVYSKAEKYNQLLDSIRESLNEKWDTDVFSSIQSDTEMMQIDKLLNSKKEAKTKHSDGVVRLRELGNDPEEFTEDEKGRRKWALKLLEIKRDPTHPLHQEVKNLSRQARSDKDLLNYLPKTIDFSEALDPSLASGDLPYNYTFKQKAEWDKEQARRKAKNAKQ